MYQKDNIHYSCRTEEWLINHIDKQRRLAEKRGVFDSKRKKVTHVQFSYVSHDYIRHR